MCGKLSSTAHLCPLELQSLSQFPNLTDDNLTKRLVLKSQGYSFPACSVALLTMSQLLTQSSRVSLLNTKVWLGYYVRCQNKDPMNND